MIDTSGTLSARSHQGFRASALRRVACSVAAAIGLSLFCGIEPLNEPSIDAIKPKSYIKMMLPPSEALCLIQLYGKESAFNPSAVGNLNGSQHTYGIPQLKNPLIASMSSIKQIDYGIKYVMHRYGSACTAWTHWTQKGWH